MVIFEAFLGFSLVLLITCSVLVKWNDMRYGKKGIPPGTMGWPLIGETTKFQKQGPSFLKSQRARYGNLFTTHILGSPTLISVDPDLNRFILMNEGKGLIPGYPKSMTDILGKFSISALNGSLHKGMRVALLSVISPTVIREQQLFCKIDQFMRSYLSDWNGNVIDIQEKTQEMWLLSSLKMIFGMETCSFSKALESEIHKLIVATLSFPINLLGTNYHQGLKARKKIVSMIRKLIEERKASGNSNNADMLDALLFSSDYLKADHCHEQLVDLIIALIYSGFETVSTTSMMAVKYLHEHPKVLEEIVNEQLEIGKRKLPDDPIDWEDYKSMKFTRAVILETLRLANVVNGELRKTTQDMVLKGYTIPKGWKIYVYTREMNLDPIIYPEPFTFNPWRWLEKNLESHQYFLAFGGGGRLCPGKDLGLVEISIFLHYFVTQYRWEFFEGEKLVEFPRVEAPNGLHIRLSKK